MNNDYTMDIDWKDGNPAEINVKIDSHEFRWVCDSVMQQPEDTRPHITYAEGTMVDLTEEKELDSHYSWIEYRPHHLWGQAAQRLG